MELMPGIHLVDRVTCHTYLIVEDVGLTLIDTGLPGSAPKVLAYVRGLGRDPRDIRRILLTHQHVDHIGGAAQLARASGADVWAHPTDAAAIEGKVARERPSGPVGVAFSLLIAARLRPFPVVRQVRDGDIVPALETEGGLRVIETPGHTMGHIAFYLPSRRLLFAGDALVHYGERVAPPPALFTRDMPLALRSLASLTVLDIETCLPGHGKPFLRGAGERIAEAAKRAEQHAA